MAAAAIQSMQAQVLFVGQGQGQVQAQVQSQLQARVQMQVQAVEQASVASVASLMLAARRSGGGQWRHPPSRDRHLRCSSNSISRSRAACSTGQQWTLSR